MSNEQMTTPLEAKLRAALDVVGGLPAKQREVIVSTAIEGLAPKGWLSSTTVRNGLVAAVTGAIAVAIEVTNYLSTGALNPEMLAGGFIGIVTGIGVIRGRGNATQLINRQKLL